MSDDPDLQQTVEALEELAETYSLDDSGPEVRKAMRDAAKLLRPQISEEQPEHEHAWRLNKHGRICVLCMKIEEGKSPYEGRKKK